MSALFVITWQISIKQAGSPAKFDLAYMAECVNTAIAQVGITQTAPSGLPQKKPSSFSIPIGVITSVQALPIGHAGGAPISAKSLTQLMSTDNSTPVKPLPDKPPLVVKIVTV